VHTSGRRPNRVLASEDVNLDLVAAAIRDRLDALGPFARAELLRVLLLPDCDRAGTIGEYHQDPRTRNFAELLIDCEEDRTLRAVLFGMLREGQRDLG
jgi:hypothetical protein